jgi:hypothetical protein
VNRLKDLLTRLSNARLWVALQFGLTLLLILVAIAWTRLPDKHAWQVALSLLIPLLLIVCALELQAATIRKLVDDDGRRVKLVWGAMTLLVWIAIGAAAWWFLNWCDDQIPEWAGYLNSKAPAPARASLFTYAHITRWLTIAEWIFRWIVLPAKVIPFAAASAQGGWRLPFRRLMRMLWNWRWWLGAVVASLVGVWLPGKLFDALPSGTVPAQVWHVSLKLAAAYLLAASSWVLLLGWFATLFSQQAPAAHQPPADEAEVPVPVLGGPPDRSLSAKADVPLSDENDQT